MEGNDEDQTTKAIISGFPAYLCLCRLSGNCVTPQSFWYCYLNRHVYLFLSDFVAETLSRAVQNKAKKP